MFVAGVSRCSTGPAPDCGGWEPKQWEEQRAGSLGGKGFLAEGAQHCDTPTPDFAVGKEIVVACATDGMGRVSSLPWETIL